VYWMIHTGNNPFEVHASVINIMSVTGEVGKNYTHVMKM